MLAMTPLAINCLMMSIGLVWMRSARSRTLMLAGISMTLSLVSVISHLRLRPLGRRGALNAEAGLASWRGTPVWAAQTSFGQPVEDALQFLARLRSQFGFQSPCQRPVQGVFPARTLVMDVGAPAGGFAGRVRMYAVRAAHDPEQRALRQHLPATHAGPLRDVSSSLALARHRRSVPAAYPSSKVPSPRLWRWRTTIVPVSGSYSTRRAGFLPFFFLRCVTGRSGTSFSSSSSSTALTTRSWAIASKVFSSAAPSAGISTATASAAAGSPPPAPAHARARAGGASARGPGS